MQFTEALNGCREKVAERWIALVARTYPEKRSQDFFLNEKDPFGNPVGHIIRTSLPEVLSLLVEGGSEEKLAGQLDPLIRLRAVQEFTAREAVLFVFQLKDLVREALKKEAKNIRDYEEAQYLFDKKVDELALLAFHIYMGCREQIWSFKSRHVMERTVNLLEKANLISEAESLGLDILPQRVYRKMKKNAEEKKDVPTQ